MAVNIRHTNMSYTVTYQTSWVLHFEMTWVIHVTRGAMYRLIDFLVIGNGKMKSSKMPHQNAETDHKM